MPHVRPRDESWERYGQDLSGAVHKVTGWSFRDCDTLIVGCPMVTMMLTVCFALAWCLLFRRRTR